MHLVKIGDKVINLDRATTIDLNFRLLADGPSKVLIHFGPAGESDFGGEESFSGDEAAAIREYIEDRATDAMKLHRQRHS